MNDMNKLPDQVKFDQERTGSCPSNNVVVIPKTKKRQINRQRTPDNAQIHILPLSHAPRQTQKPVDSIPVHLQVLLVEENAGERYACGKALQKSPDFIVDLIEVSNGEEGLSLACRQKFDCILLDYQLPDMSGMEFLGRLTELTDGLRLPVLKLIGPEKSHQAIEMAGSRDHDYLIKDNDGHYLQLLPSLIQRILERQSLSNEKHQIEAMYRTLVEHIPAITYIASLRNGNHLLYVSPQIEQLGYLSDKWLANPDLRFQCVYQEDRLAVEQAFANSCKSGEMFRCEYRMLSSGGKLHWFIDEARVIKGHDGQALFFQGVMLDITYMKVMENELDEHRYFLEQRVQGRTEQLEKRITILESCNAELCDLLEKERMTCHELRKINLRYDSVECAVGDVSGSVA